MSCVNYSCIPSYFSNCTIISYLVVKFYFVLMSIYINKQKHYLIAKFISYSLIVFFNGNSFCGFSVYKSHYAWTINSYHVLFFILVLSFSRYQTGICRCVWCCCVISFCHVFCIITCYTIIIISIHYHATIISVRRQVLSIKNTHCLTRRSGPIMLL